MPEREGCSGYSVDNKIGKQTKCVLIVFCQACINFTEIIQFLLAFETVYMPDGKEHDPAISKCSTMQYHDTNVYSHCISTLEKLTAYIHLLFSRL